MKVGSGHLVEQVLPDNGTSNLAGVRWKSVIARKPRNSGRLLPRAIRSPKAQPRVDIISYFLLYMRNDVNSRDT